MFRRGDIPKRLIPGTIALGAFTFTMDALPGTPQIQNIIPTTFFGTNTWAAPWLGVIGGAFILTCGLSYLEWRRRQAVRSGEGYGTSHSNEPEQVTTASTIHPLLAILPLLVVGITNLLFTRLIPRLYEPTIETELAGLAQPLVMQLSGVVAIWAVMGALLMGIVTVLLFAFRPVIEKFAEGTRTAVGGALLASMNTASEYGFGAVIAALPGFLIIRNALMAIPDPLAGSASHWRRCRSSS
jgi:H+/gluconate symporter-like permease